MFHLSYSATVFDDVGLSLRAVNHEFRDAHHKIQNILGIRARSAYSRVEFTICIGPDHMPYQVKEIYYTLQGEGWHTGRPAVFCRFAGCNLWSGRETDRASAQCRFCDTDFVGTDGPGGGAFTDAGALARAVAETWPTDGGGAPFVVCTGGEPLLQVTADLIDAFHGHGFEVAVETNGTVAPPAEVIDGLDWICVSPKAATNVVLRQGNELKLVFPQTEPEARPEQFTDWKFDRFLLQPMDGPDRDANTKAAVTYCLDHPQWGLSVQTHKFLGIP